MQFSKDGALEKVEKICSKTIGTPNILLIMRNAFKCRNTRNIVSLCIKMVKYHTNKVSVCEIANVFVILLILLHGFNEIGFLTLELRY